MYKRIINVLKNTGPGPLIAAAFIGPGTVTLCTISGAYYGMSLLWAVLFSILAAIILQEMSVRLGIITQKSIPQLLREEIKNPVFGLAYALCIGYTFYQAKQGVPFI